MKTYFSSSAIELIEVRFGRGQENVAVYLLTLTIDKGTKAKRNPSVLNKLSPMLASRGSHMCSGGMTGDDGLE